MKEKEFAILGQLIVNAVEGEIDLVKFATNVITDKDFTEQKYKKIFEGIKKIYICNGEKCMSIADFANIGLKNDEVLKTVDMFTKHLVTENKIKKDIVEFKKDKLNYYTSKKITGNAENKIEIIEENIKEQKKLDELLDNNAQKDFKQRFIDFNNYISKVQNGEIKRVKTGYKFFDNLIKVKGKQENHVIAGRPSMGKTSFALNLLRNMMNSNPGATAVIFSLETPVNDMLKRYIAADNNIKMNNFEGGFEEHEMDKLQNKAEKFAEINKNLYVEEEYRSIEDIEKYLDRIHNKHKNIDFILIDHLSLIRVKNGKFGTDSSKYSYISDKINEFKVKYGAHVINIVQLNRAVESRECKIPVMSDLRESGAIEQDADIISMVYRPSYYKNDVEVNETNDKMEIYVRKNRNGRTANWAFWFNMQTNNIKEVTLGEMRN